MVGAEPLNGGEGVALIFNGLSEDGLEHGPEGGAEGGSGLGLVLRLVGHDEGRCVLVRLVVRGAGD